MSTYNIRFLLFKPVMINLIGTKCQWPFDYRVCGFDFQVLPLSSNLITMAARPMTGAIMGDTAKLLTEWFWLVISDIDPSLLRL